MDELLYKIALTLIPKVGPVTAKNLVSYCGGVRAVFEARKRELLKIPGVGPQTAEQIIRKDSLERAATELKFIEQHGIQPLFYLDPDYPQRLRHFPDCPALLYFKGNASLNPERSVAIVGTRKPTPHGLQACEEIVEGLAPYGITVVSGLAYGVDVAAHRKCLELGVATIGVLGHGLQLIYPSPHRAVAKAMAQNGGLLSEFPGDTLPERENFPMRNRIVAALCDALVVVETKRKGGSMISAQLANDYNRDVFAIPGRVRDKCSEGCNLLIKSHRAALVESAADIAYVMRWEEPSRTGGVQQQLFVELTDAEKIIVDLLNQNEVVSIDQLTIISQMNGSEMAGLLLELEFKGVIRALPGKRYILAGSF